MVTTMFFHSFILRIIISLLQDNNWFSHDNRIKKKSVFKIKDCFLFTNHSYQRSGLALKSGYMIFKGEICVIMNQTLETWDECSLDKLSCYHWKNEPCYLVMMK